MRRALLAGLLAGAVVAAAAPAPAHTTPAQGLVEQLGFDQRLGERVPLDLAFRDETGRTVTLEAALDGRPAILVLLYYRCTMLCPLLLDGLVRGLRDVGFQPGKEFRILTLSIDPREGPDLAATKKTITLQRYGRPTAERGWLFLTGQEPAIAALAKAVGFRYQYDQSRDEYAHPAGLVLLTPEGAIARYFYGVDFPPRDLRLGLVEAAQSRIGSPVDQLLLLCYHYDPLTGKYGLVIMNVLRLAGSATALALAAFIFVMVRRDRAPRPDAAGE